MISQILPLAEQFWLKGHKFPESCTQVKPGLSVLVSCRYLLQPKGNGNKHKPDDLGSLRLKVNYVEDTVLPSSCYKPLCNLLLKSPDVKV